MGGAAAIAPEERGQYLLPKPLRKRELGGHTGPDLDILARSLSWAPAPPGPRGQSFRVTPVQSPLWGVLSLSCPVPPCHPAASPPPFIRIGETEARKQGNYPGQQSPKEKPRGQQHMSLEPDVGTPWCTPLPASCLVFPKQPLGTKPPRTVACSPPPMAQSSNWEPVLWWLFPVGKVYWRDPGGARGALAEPPPHVWRHCLGDPLRGGHSQVCPDKGQDTQTPRLQSR